MIYRGFGEEDLTVDVQRALLKLSAFLAERCNAAMVWNGIGMSVQALDERPIPVIYVRVRRDYDDRSRRTEVNGSWAVIDIQRNSPTGFAVITLWSENAWSPSGFVPGGLGALADWLGCNLANEDEHRFT